MNCRKISSNLICTESKKVKKGTGYSTLYTTILVSQFITVVKGLLVMVIYMYFVISYSVTPKFISNLEKKHHLTPPPSLPLCIRVSYFLHTSQVFT